MNLPLVAIAASRRQALEPVRLRFLRSAAAVLSGPCGLGLPIGLAAILWLLLPGLVAQSPPGGVPLARLTDGPLKEISGLAASRTHPGLLWAHNDGPDGRLFALGTNGQLVATFRLGGPVEDLEDVALGPGPDPARDHLYLGDIGDNAAQRPVIRVYRVPEPDPRPGTSPKEPALIPQFETLTLRYPDGPRDAETLLCHPRTGDLLVVTKHKRKAGVYQAPASSWTALGGAAVLVHLGDLEVRHISAGDLSPDGQHLLLRREDAAYLWSWDARDSLPAALARLPARVPVIGPPDEPNGEAIAWAPDGRGYYTVSEGKRQPIHYFALP